MDTEFKPLTVKEYLLNVLNRSSGGMKYTELIPIVISECYENEYVRDLFPGDNILLIDFPDFLEKEIEKIPEIGILTYFHYSGTLPREKRFVYTK